MATAMESMVVDEKQLPEKPVDREKVKKNIIDFDELLIY